MEKTIFPTLEEALYLHDQLIERFAGPKGVRDLGLLDSTLKRPQSGYYTSLSEQAAALFQSLVSNHAFVDGNKRVAFALTAIFLDLNGYSLVINDIKKAHSFIIQDIIEKKANLSTITLWIEAHLSKKPKA